MPKAFNSFSGGVHGAPHFLQILRTNRWAINARVDDATRNGFTPRAYQGAVKSYFDDLKE
jgi:hypothetical protein